MMTRFIKFTVCALLGLTLSQPVLANPEVNVYSARKENLIKLILKRFTQQTGIKVNLLTGKADALIKRLESEGLNSPADLLITTDAGRLHRAKMMGLFQPFSSPILQSKIPANLRDTDNQWVGLSLRTRTIIYSPHTVSAQDLSRYEDLSDPKWKGRLCVRSSSNIYNQSLVASMLVANGEAATEQWARGLVNNMARSPQGGDRDQIKAVAAGQCDLALANTYYLGKMLKGRDKKQRKIAKSVAVFWPNQSDRGAHVNVSGAGITQHAKNPDHATALLEFLVSEEAQRWYADTNHEYPVISGMAGSKLVNTWGDFKGDSLNLSKLGENNAQAVMIMDRAGWK